MSEPKRCFKRVDYDLSGRLHYVDIDDIGSARPNAHYKSGPTGPGTGKPAWRGVAYHGATPGNGYRPPAVGKANPTPMLGGGRGGGVFLRSRCRAVRGRRGGAHLT